MSAIETLETRGLLSAVAPVQLPPLEIAELDRASAALVASETVQDDRSDSAEAALASSDANDRAARRVVSSPSDARSNSASDGAIRRSSTNNASRRDLADSLGLATWSIDLASSAPTGEASPSAAQELMSGLGIGDAADPAAALASVFGQGPDAADQPGQTDVLDGQAANRPGTSTAARAGATAAAGLASSARIPKIPQTLEPPMSRGRWPFLVSLRGAQPRPR